MVRSLSHCCFPAIQLLKLSPSLHFHQTTLLQLCQKPHVEGPSLQHLCALCTREHYLWWLLLCVYTHDYCAQQAEACIQCLSKEAKIHLAHWIKMILCDTAKSCFPLTTSYYSTFPVIFFNLILRLFTFSLGQEQSSVTLFSQVLTCHAFQQSWDMFSFQTLILNTLDHHFEFGKHLERQRVCSQRMILLHLYATAVFFEIDTLKEFQEDTIIVLIPWCRSKNRGPYPIFPCLLPCPHFRSKTWGNGLSRLFPHQSSLKQNYLMCKAGLL